MFKRMQFLLAVCPLLTCGAAMAADPFDTVGPFVQYTKARGQPLQTVFGSDWVTATISNANGSAEIVGRGGIGVAKVGLSSTGTFDAFAWSGWNDSITLTPADPTLVGQTAHVEFKIGFDWSASLVGSASGQAFVDINLVRESDLEVAYSWVWEDIVRSCVSTGSCGEMGSESIGGGVPTFGNDSATFYFDVILGQPYTLVVGMNASTSIDGGNVAIDATHSATWAGIGDITLGDQALPFEVSSATGFDYTQAAPVPELAPGALLLTGLLAMALRRGTRDAARQPST